MSLKFFGTDGIRGEYGGDILNDEIAFRAGVAAAKLGRERLGASAPRIVVGRDTRASGEALLAAFAKGVHREGGVVVDLGIAPTPCVAHSARVSEAVLACSITASHNPASDNGLKFFQGDGVKPSVELEQALDDAIAEATVGDKDTTDTKRLEDGSLLREAYANAVSSFFEADTLAGKRIALDCANGAMCKIAPPLFEKLGAMVDLIGCEPDGGNINAGLGSEHPEALQAMYKSGNYDFGFAFDGDGDRVILFDEAGERVSGEAVLAALAIDAMERGVLESDALVTTVQSNLGLDAALEARGISVLRTDVGDKHIARLMLRDGYRVGGEESGHLVLGEFAVTGDGLFAALRLAECISRKGCSAKNLVGLYEPFPQSSKAIRVAAKPPLDTCSAIQDCMKRLGSSLGRNGRLLVRYSGTEPKLRLLVEARSVAHVTEAMEALMEAVNKDLETVS